MPYIIGGVVALVLSVIGFFSGSAYRSKADKTAVGTAKDEARRILNDAIKNAETKKKELLIEAKDEVVYEATEENAPAEVETETEAAE